MNKLVIDTDMGNDDMMAISILIANKINLFGITTVFGVARNDIGYKNIHRLLKYLGKENIPTAKGASIALVEKTADFPRHDCLRAENFVLLSNLNIPEEETSFNTKDTAVNFISDFLTKENIDILALGPLTNIANLINKNRSLALQKINRIYIMGGGVGVGNVSPLKFAEYNIWLDPEAASVVFGSGIPITMVGINATNCVPATKEFENKVRVTNPLTPESRIIKEIIINNDNDLDVYYDPLTAAILVDPTIVTQSLNCGIGIELNGERRGETVISNSNPQIVSVIYQASDQKFYNHVLNLLS